jgi:hypothetical protein
MTEPQQWSGKTIFSALQNLIPEKPAEDRKEALC